jgi:phage shock protein E
MDKTSIIIIVLIVFMRFVFPLIWNRQYISFKALRDLIQSESKLILLDVRTGSEYKSGHIPGSKNAPQEKLLKVLNKTNKETSIVVYCQSGARARRAKKTLISSGYTNVQTFGGISRWKSELE